MILQALTRYYEILAQNPSLNIAPPAYSSTGVTFAVNISAAGELLDILPLSVTEMRGKKSYEVPKRMIVPEQVKKTSGINSNFLCENPGYFLGICEQEEDAPRTLNTFEEFRRLHLELLSNVDCNPARAVIAFLQRYDPLTGKDHPEISRNLPALLKGGNLVFMFRGEYVQDDPIIRRAWEAYKAGQVSAEGQCLVTGETAPIARLQPGLKGVRDANPTGASLVSFNAAAYESYNRQQGLNAPVSEQAAFAYGTALNFLLSSANPNRKFYLGDTTVVYWAESADPRYASAWAGIFDPGTVEETAQENLAQKAAEERLKDAGEKVRRVQALDRDKLLEGLDPNTQFYVLGLAPNVARVSVRFFIAEPFGKIIDRIMQHYRDLEIVKEYDNQPSYITLGHILAETVSKKARDQDAAPLMAGAVTRAILSGQPYPAALYNAVLIRMRADQDDKEKRIQKINYVRAAVIKAYLTRKYRHSTDHLIKEVLSMSLNEQSTHPAYVLGRLFAVLEKVQQEAVGSVNASIKDRYFTAACAAPASVFPVLLRLSQHHISKAEFGKSSDRKIQEILNLLDIQNNPIPARLSLDEQGVFILGYYHQRAAFYAPRNSVQSIPVED